MSIFISIMVVVAVFLVIGSIANSSDQKKKEKAKQQRVKKQETLKQPLDNSETLRVVVKDQDPKKLALDVEDPEMLRKIVTAEVKELDERDYFCKIAGASHHCDESDIGGFIGTVRHDANNKYDKYAHGVYNLDGKLLGYIPKDELADYIEFSGGKDRNCVGFIKTGEHVPFYGKVKVLPFGEAATTESIAFILWMVKNLGKMYIPKKGFNVTSDQPLKTKKDWIAFLENYLEEHDYYGEDGDDEDDEDDEDED